MELEIPISELFREASPREDNVWFLQCCDEEIVTQSKGMVLCLGKMAPGTTAHVLWENQNGPTERDNGQGWIEGEAFKGQFSNKATQITGVGVLAHFGIAKCQLRFSLPFLDFIKDHIYYEPPLYYSVCCPFCHNDLEHVPGYRLRFVERSA